MYVQCTCTYVQCTCMHNFGMKFQEICLLPIQPDPKDPFVDLASNTPIVSGDVTGYQVTVTGMTPVNLDSSTTWYTADVTENEYTVSIAAVNILGVGNPASLGPYSEWGTASAYIYAIVLTYMYMYSCEIAATICNLRGPCESYIVWMCMCTCRYSLVPRLSR